MNDVSLVEFEGPLGELVQQCKSNRGRFDEFKLWLKKVVTGTFKCDMREDGWTLLENSPRRISSIIDAVPFLKNESSVKGDMMAARSIELNANYGQEDAEWLLENQDMISVKLRNFCLVFPATKWRDSVGLSRVPCLHWYGGRWCLEILWFAYDFGVLTRLVRPRK